MSNLDCADEEAGEGRSDKECSPTPSADLWHRSVAALLKPLAIGK